MPLPPKKYYGQHFLKEQSIAQRICDSLQGMGQTYDTLLEIGPGPGILTSCLYEAYGDKLYLVEIDEDMIPGLQHKFPAIAGHIHRKDFLELDLKTVTEAQLGIIGNFPYNISSQILFKLVDNRSQVPELVGMFQREVAQRVTAQPGNKIYGLISVWVQAFYDTEYLFTVSEGSFNPPPKVKSGVIRLTRKADYVLDVNEHMLLQVIKAGFNQRRKTLRNALSVYKPQFDQVPPALLDRRAETLSFQDFIELTRMLGGSGKNS